MSRSAGEADASLLGATSRARWVFGLGAFAIFIFTEAWMKPFNGGGVEPADSGLIRSLYYPG